MLRELLDKWFGRHEKRVSLSTTNPRDPVLAAWFGGGANTVAGVSISPDSAMQLTAVYACVRILASALASLPIQIYRRLDAGRELYRQHPLQQLLHYAPNQWQTSYEWREMQMAHLLLRGNAYSYKNIRGDGTIIGLNPLHPDSVEPEWSRDRTKIKYRYQDPGGSARIFDQSEVFHVRGLGFDMLKGLSPIEYAKESLGATAAMEQFGAAFFGNGANLGSILEHPGNLGDEAHERLNESMKNYRLAKNAHKNLILEEGMKWRQIAVEPEHAQFLESRGFQTEEIARLFGVPPNMIAHTTKDTSWGSGIEQQTIGFVTYSLRPWLVRWEQAIQRDLISPAESSDVYAEFNVDGLLRGDSKSRAEYYNLGINAGWLAPNEAREKENLNRRDGLDETWKPLNMAGSDEPDRSVRALERVHQDQLSRAFDRIVTCEIKALRRAMNRAEGDITELDALAARFYMDHKKFVAKALDGLVKNPSEFSERHVIDSVSQVKTALDTDSLDELLVSWDASRTAALYMTHAESALRGIQHAE